MNKKANSLTTCLLLIAVCGFSQNYHLYIKSKEYFGSTRTLDSIQIWSDNSIIYGENSEKVFRLLNNSTFDIIEKKTKQPTPTEPAPYSSESVHEARGYHPRYEWIKISHVDSLLLLGISEFSEAKLTIQFQSTKQAISQCNAINQMLLLIVDQGDQLTKCLPNNETSLISKMSFEFTPPNPVPKTYHLYVQLNLNKNESIPDVILSYFESTNNEK